MAEWLCRLASVGKTTAICSCGAKFSLTIEEKDLGDGERMDALLDLYRGHVKARMKAQVGK